MVVHKEAVSDKKYEKNVQKKNRNEKTNNCKTKSLRRTNKLTKISYLCKFLISSSPPSPPVTTNSPEMKTRATSSFNLASSVRSFPLMEYLHRDRLLSCLQHTTMFPYSERARPVTWQGLGCAPGDIPMGLSVTTYSPFRAVWMMHVPS